MYFRKTAYTSQPTAHPNIFDESALLHHGEKDELLVAYTITKYILLLA